MKYKVVENPENLCVKCPASLKEKVFIPKQTNCQYLFTIGRLGESLYNDALAKLKMKDFVFYDPNNRETPVEYNSFFDPHLREYFHRRKSVLNLLRKNHLITDRNEIICNVEDYNALRRSIHRIKMEALNLKERERNQRDVVNQANFIENYKRITQHKASAGGSRIGKRREMENQRLAKFVSNLNAYNSRVDKIKKLKMLKEHEIKERGYYRNLELVKKRIFVLERRKQRRAEIKKKIVEREEAVKRRLYVDGSLEPTNFIIRCPLKI